MTIAKNTKKAHEVFENARSCRVFSLGNNFCGQECEIARAKEALYRFSFAKLRTDPFNGHTVYVHSNLWYELVPKVGK